MPAPADTLARLAAELGTPDDVAHLFAAEPLADGERSRIAAVAALLRLAPTGGGGLELLLIRRAERAGDVWSGHMALPGGRRERDDADLVATAVRETREEVGVDLRGTDSSLLGALPVLAPSNPRLPQITVVPLVWRVGAAEPGVSAEVAAARWISIAHLRAMEHRIEHALELPDGTTRSFPAVALDDDVLWGMTHTIVHTLLDAIDRADGTRLRG